LYSWKLVPDNEYLKLEGKKLFKETFHKVRGIVSPSNYKLQYDILKIDQSAKFFKPEDFKFGKRNEFTINKIEVKKEFEKYIKRSYLSYLNYHQLSSLGLKRIEQYMSMLGVFSLRNVYEYDNLMIKEELKIIKLTKIKKEIVKIKNIDIVKFTNLLNKELKYGFEDIFKFILQMYSNLEITDPFYKNGFKFLNQQKDNDIYILYNEIFGKDIEIEYIKATCKTKENKTVELLIKKGINSNNFIDKYLMLQTDNYFEGKIIFSEKFYPNILYIEEFLKPFFPKKDILLNIYTLIKLKKIKQDKMYLYIEENLLKIMNIKKNLAWINKNVWKEIYENQDYLFNNIIDPLNIKSSDFVCPVCGEESYRVTPQKLFCSKKGCNFKFNRINLKELGIEKLSKEQMIEALNVESLFVKTKENKNLPLFLNNKNGYYYLYL